MPTATKVRRRAVAAARQAAHDRALVRARRRGQWIVLAASLAVLAIAAALVLVGTLRTEQRKPSAEPPRTPVPASVLAAVTGVQPAVIDAVGNGIGAIDGSRPPTGGSLTGPSGHPEVLYIGGEYCPFCAVERWAIVQALSRFGTFTNLSLTHSASDDVNPDTPSFSFYGAGYDSPYIDFVGRELYTNEPLGRFYQPLERLPVSEQRLFAPYNSFPFLDIGGRFVTTGATYDDALIKGLTAAQIATALNDPTSQVAKGVIGAANRLTARICAVTGQQPTDVCTAKGVLDAASHS